MQGVVRLNCKNLATTPGLAIKADIAVDIKTNVPCVRQRSVVQLLLQSHFLKKMKFFVAVFALVAAASAGVIPATTLVRAPSHDSAIIQSDRIGGNFAYSSVEGHAYAAVSPVVQNVVSPVGISYSATPVATPINLVHQQVQYVATPQFIAGPQLIAHPGLYTQPAVIAPVAPGIIAPSFPIAATENLTPVAPEAPQEQEKPAEAIVPAPAEPAAPAEVITAEQPAPQADDVVAVESL